MAEYEVESSRVPDFGVWLLSRECRAFSCAERVCFPCVLPVEWQPHRKKAKKHRIQSGAFSIVHCKRLCLFGVECEATERGYGELFVLSFEVLLDGVLRVFYKLLLQEGELFVIFLQRTLCDAVDEVFGLAGFAGFVAGDFELFLDDMGGNLFGTNSNGVHGSHLHGNVAGYLMVYLGLVEAYDGSQFITRVNVEDGRGGGEGVEVSEFHLFAGYTALVGNEFGNGATFDGYGFEGFEVGRFVLDGCVEDFLGQGNEVFVLSHKVGFAFQSHDSGVIAFAGSQYAAFGGFAVFTFGGDSLTSFANDFYGTFEVVIGFLQCFFAVHHTGSGHFAELGNICHCNSHNIFLF